MVQPLQPGDGGRRLHHGSRVGHAAVWRHSLRACGLVHGGGFPRRVRSAFAILLLFIGKTQRTQGVRLFVSCYSVCLLDSVLGHVRVLLLSLRHSERFVLLCSVVSRQAHAQSCAEIRDVILLVIFKACKRCDCTHLVCERRNNKLDVWVLRNEPESKATSRPHSWKFAGRWLIWWIGSLEQKESLWYCEPERNKLCYIRANCTFKLNRDRNFTLDYKECLTVPARGGPPLWEFYLAFYFLTAGNRSMFDCNESSFRLNKKPTVPQIFIFHSQWNIYLTLCLQSHVKKC